METEVPVEVVSVDYTCDRCITGHMRPNGVSTHSPVTYPHVCTSCGHRASLDKRYPDIIYRIPETPVPRAN